LVLGRKGRIKHNESLRIKKQQRYIIEITKEEGSMEDKGITEDNKGK